MFLSNTGHFSVLSEFQVGQTRDSCISVSGSPRQIRTDKHNNLPIRSALLPLKPEARVLHWVGVGCHLQGHRQGREGLRIEQVKMPYSFLIIVRLPFVCLLVCF